MTTSKNIRIQQFSVCNVVIQYDTICFKENKMAKQSADDRKLLQQNLRDTKRQNPDLPKQQLSVLRDLTTTLHLSTFRGELLYLSGKWYVSHSGLLRIAQRRRCVGIDTEIDQHATEASTGRWVFRATVHKSKSTSFVGYGDANPFNVSSLVRGAEMRVAETRAVNRALRKAYGIGICSVEEIGTIPNPVEKLPPQNANSNGNGAGPKVRDRLCQLIRQHKLDPELVKAYAVDFCGKKKLREASREQVENFVQQLADWAARDRNALICQLNSYLPPTRDVVA
jgi:hypothetical protein